MTEHSQYRRVLALAQALATTILTGIPVLTAAADGPRLSRVRANNPSIGAVVAEAKERSATFRRLLETIDGTDGLVYIEEGKCLRSVRSCLLLSVTVAGPYRLLRILVDLRKAAGEELMASIGHELQHAVEVLSDPTITSDGAIYLFYDRRAPSLTGRFETDAAIRAGLDVLNELLAKRDRR